MSEILRPGAVPVHSVWLEGVQYRAKLQEFSHASGQLVVRAVDFSAEKARYVRAYYNALSSTESGATVEVKRRGRVRGSEAVGKPEDVERARRKARSAVLRCCRELAPTTLMTFTSRGHLRTLDDVFAAWKALLRVIRERGHDVHFGAVMVPELHASGEHWHMHLATRSGLRPRVLRECWHIALGRVIGVKITETLYGADAPGNVDIKRRRGGGAVNRAEWIAGYMSKYLTKDFHRVAGRRCWTRTRNVKLSAPERVYLGALDLESAKREALSAFGAEARGDWWTPGDAELAVVRVGRAAP